MGLKSFTAYLDAVSVPFLEDALVDYATDRMGGQLTIKAPNAKVPMVNEDSPINERINYYLQTEINPGLASTVARSVWWTWSTTASRCCSSVVVAKAAARPMLP